MPGYASLAAGRESGPWRRNQAPWRIVRAMALRILNAPSDSEPLVAQLRERIERELPGARARVRCASPGHFEIEVESAAFTGKPRVRQHQLVYAAIAPLMAGDAALVHAIDRLDCRIPG